MRCEKGAIGIIPGAAGGGARPVHFPTLVVQDQKLGDGQFLLVELAQQRLDRRVLPLHPGEHRPEHPIYPQQGRVDLKQQVARARLRRASHTLQCRSGIAKRLLVGMTKREKGTRAIGEDQNCTEHDHGVLGPKAPLAKDNRYKSH